MQNQPPNEEFQFEDFYYKSPTRSFIYHLLQLNRTVNGIVLDFEEDGNQEIIDDYFNFENYKYPILRKIFSRYRPSSYTIYHLYIYDRGMDNSCNSELGKILTNHILYCSSAFELEGVIGYTDEEGLQISRKVYEQCIEWIKKTKVLSHLVDDLTEYLLPYCSHEDLSELSLDNEEKPSLFNVDESGIIHLTPREPVIIKKNHAMQVLNDLLAKGPVDFTAFWSDLEYNFRFGEEVITAPIFYEEFSSRHSNHNFTLNSETNHIVLIRTSKYTFEMLEDYKILNKTTNKNMYSRIKFKKNEKQDLDDFFALYEKYLNALSCNLVFAKCASKLTRVDKLYSKELMFTTTNKTSGKDKISWQMKTMFAGQKYTKYEKDKSIYLDLQNTLHSSEKDLPKRNTEMLNKKLAKTRLSIKNFEVKNEINTYHKFLEEKQKVEWEKRDQERQIPVFTKKKDLQHKLTDIIRINLEEGKVPKPLVLSGEAGMGKTITIHQIALNYVNELEHIVELHEPLNISNLNLPIFFKAKKLDSELREYKATEMVVEPREYKATPRESVLESLNEQFASNRWIQDVISSQFATFPDFNEYISEVEMHKLIRLWSGLSDLHNGNVTYFIDGLDELPNKTDAQKAIQNSLENQFTRYKQSFLFCSTRPSFYSNIEKTIGRIGHSIAKLIPQETFSEKELSHEMPNMLCDAWGINRTTAENLRSNIKKYRHVIKHPLFVGWICYLIYTDNIDDDTNVSGENIDVATNNILAKIIEIGITSSVNRKDVKGLNIDKFTQDVRTFVSFSFHYSLTRPSDVFRKMRNVMGKYLNKITRETIKNDCGILFLTSNKIEWTHQRIAEIIYADYRHNNQQTLLGPLRPSDPVLSRIAQNRCSDGFYNNYDEALIRTWHKYLESDAFSIKIRDTYLTVIRSIMGIRNGELVILEGITDAQKVIGQLYISHLDTKNAFRISSLMFENDRNIRHILYSQSKHVFAKDILFFEEDDETPSPLLSLSGNLVEFDKLDFSRLDSNTEAVELWRYIFRETLGDNPGNISYKLLHELLGLTSSYSPKDIFDIDWHGLIGLEMGFDQYNPNYYSAGELHPYFWFPEISSSLLDPLSQILKSSLLALRSSFISYAMTYLFGIDEEKCRDLLWRELHDKTCLFITGYGEYSNAEECNMLSALMFEYSLNVGTEEACPGHEIPIDMRKVLDVNNEEHRSLMLFPFINECIKIIESKANNPYHPNYKFDCEEISDFFTRNRYFRAFELIKDYYPNLLTKQ